MKNKIFIFFLMIYLICGFFYNSLATENMATENKTNISQQLDLHSEGAVLLEINTGKVLYEKNMNERLYPASITKILTAILVLENCNNLNDYATASEYAIKSIPSGYTTAGIKVGESFTIENLLEVMMLRSANEAATILAEYISGNVNEFSKLMNEKAKEIGCVNSNFLNANGMHDENHYSTAYDMALIERYCMQNQDFRRISALTECSLPDTDIYEGEPRIFKNTHAFLIKDSPNYYPYAIAGKTGFTTPAKNCLVTCAKKDEFELVAVVLHADGKVDGVSARYHDTKLLLDYGFNNYKIEKYLSKGSVINTIQIETVDGKKEYLNLELAEDISIIQINNQKPNSSGGKINLNDIKLPIKKGDILGTVTYTINDQNYTINLLAEESIEGESEVSGVSFEIEKKFDFLPIIILLGLVGVAIIVIIIFIIVMRREKKEKLNFS